MRGRRFRRHGESRLLGKLVWLLLLALLLTPVVGFINFVTTLPSHVEDETTRVDAIVVLTGGGDRMTTGMALLSANLGDRLFVSGVHKGVETTDILRAAHVEAGGIIPRVQLGHDAEDTVGNADETARWVQAEGIHSIRLVTASYHMPRSLWEFHRAMPDLEIIPHPVFPDRVRGDRWGINWGTTELLAVEYGKYLAAHLRVFIRKGFGP